MPYFQAAGSIISGGISARASGKASEKARAAAEKAAKRIQTAGDVARTDALSLFPESERQLIGGAQAAFDIFGQGIGAQQQALSQGNLNAQQTVGSGFGQVQNALLGLPVNTQSFAPQGVDFTQGVQNPFSVEGGGQSLIGGTARDFETGQGRIPGRTGGNIAGTQPIFLNPISGAFDEGGGVIRNPDGSINLDLGFGQDPNSASIAPQGAVHQVAQDDFRRRFGRHLEGPGNALIEAIGTLRGKR